MKSTILLVGLFIISATAMTCQKKACPVIEEEPALPNVDSISYQHFDRDDISPPPREQWWTLDTTNLDTCENLLWGYLKRMYPNQEEDYWDYDTYSIMDEPAEVFANRALRSQFMWFFNDTMYSQMLQDESLPCRNVDSTFFLQALGQPTCRAVGYHTGVITYTYYFKLRYRRGPCPNIYNQGGEYEYKCQSRHLKYCPAGMKVRFEKEQGKLIYIDLLLQ